jgi:hypothetical protein
MKTERSLKRIHRGNFVNSLRKKQKLKEYFLTAPLLKAPFLIKARGCVIELRGQDGFSSIKGPNQIKIDAALDDLVCVIIASTSHCLTGFRLVLRSKTKPAKVVYKEGRQTPQDWLSWAFSRVRLSDIPTAGITLDEWKKIADTLQ